MPKKVDEVEDDEHWALARGSAGISRYRAITFGWGGAVGNCGLACAEVRIQYLALANQGLPGDV